MKSPEQLKGAIRNIADKKSIQAAAVLQMYLPLVVRMAWMMQRRDG